jgi:hypothetical protein
LQRFDEIAIVPDFVKAWLLLALVFKYPRFCTVKQLQVSKITANTAMTSNKHFILSYMVTSNRCVVCCCTIRRT